MDYGQKLALVHHWWTWNHPDIRAALTLALVDQFADSVSAAFKQNRASHEKPRSIEELAGREILRRDPVHAGRVLAGGNLATVQFLLGLAVSLRIPLSELLPEQGSLIAAMSVHLSSGNVAKADADCYGEYRSILGCQEGRVPNDLVIRQLAESREEKHGAVQFVENQITRVATALGPHLSRIDLELEERKEK